MKHYISRTIPAALLLLSILNLQLSTCFAQGTAFTYQGQLTEGGSPAGGIYDLRFTIYDLSSGGTQQGGVLTNAATTVSNGLFTVTLDFGNQFPGADRWLEIGVVTNGGGAFTTLAPRQQITATPYAVRAANFSGTIAAAQLSGTYTGAVTFNNIANSFTGNGGSLTGLSATALSSGIVPSAALANAWRIAGNAGTSNGTHFVGTTDNQALDFRVFSQRGLRLQPNTNGTPTIIGGSLSNVVSAHTPGATIAGGDRNTIFSFPGAGLEFTSAYAVISGGSSNSINNTSAHAVIGGGFKNSISGNNYFSTIAGGIQNSTLDLAAYSTIGGGRSNTVGQVAQYATIGGGAENYIGGFSHFSGIGAGMDNIIQSNAQYSVISGGWENTIGDGVFYSHVGGGQRNQILAGWNGTISGGGGNSIEGDSGAIGGGAANGIRAGAYDSTIGGGEGNIIQTNANTSVIAGGGGNQIQNDASTSFIGGGSNNRISTNADSSVIGGGGINIVQRDADHATIGGGQLNTISPGAEQSVIGGGDGNTVGATAGTVGGGALNRIETNAVQSVIAGGGGNRVNAGAANSTIGGGFGNVIGDDPLLVNGLVSTIAGGQQNSISNDGATIGGGGQNTNSGYYATIPGGALNLASGQFSFAAGVQARALHDGSFVWADFSTTSPFSSTGNNQFLIRATGGVGIGTTAPIHPLHIAAADPVIVLQDTGANATQVGYISYRDGSSTETGWVGYGSSGSPDFSIVNARTNGDIILFPILGNVGISRTPATNRLEVEGNASKTAAGSWLANSDARIKTDVQTVTGALDKLSQVRLVEFHYTEDYRAKHPSLEDRSYLNVVAQEFQNVFPEHVQSSGEKLPGGGDAILQVDTYPLTIYSAAAIQELNQKLARKETEIAELEARLEKLEQLIVQKPEEGAK